MLTQNTHIDYLTLVRMYVMVVYNMYKRDLPDVYMSEAQGLRAEGIYICKITNVHVTSVM